MQPEPNPTDTGSIRSLLLLGLGMAVLYGAALFRPTLWGHEEPFMAAIVQEMLDRGDLVVPTLNGAPYLEKPPLYPILAALACGITGGVTPWGLRLPSALLALGTGAWVGWIALRLRSTWAAGWAGFLLLSSFHFFEIGETAVVDRTLTAAASLALGAAYLAIREPGSRDRWVRVFWVGTGAAFLAKGVVGPAVVLAPVVVTLLLFRRRDLARAFLRPNAGMAFGFALSLALWLDRRVPRGPGGRDPWLLGILGLSLALATLTSAGMPWVMARDGLFSGPTAAFLACVSLLLGLLAARRAWRRDAVGLLRGAMGIWAFFLVVMVGFAAPALDRRVWRPIMDPFHRAAALREAGASVSAAGLSEPQVGAACLTLGAPVRMVTSVEEARTFLAAGRPAVLVTGRRWWQTAAGQGLEGVELPLAADGLARQRQDRIAVLVGNPAAAALQGEVARSNR